MSDADRYDYMGRCRERQHHQNLADRRRLTVRAEPQICVKVAGSDAEVSELVFDGAPTIAALMARVGAAATILSIETVHRPVRLFSDPVAAE